MVCRCWVWHVTRFIWVRSEGHRGWWERAGLSPACCRSSDVCARFYSCKTQGNVSLHLGPAFRWYLQTPNLSLPFSFLSCWLLQACLPWGGWLTPSGSGHMILRNIPISSVTLPLPYKLRSGTAQLVSKRGSSLLQSGFNRAPSCFNQNASLFISSRVQAPAWLSSPVIGGDRVRGTDPAAFWAVFHGCLS